MTDPDLQQRLSHLFRDAAKAHHAAFAASAGKDPEWPLWYANYLLEPLGRMLDTTFTKSHLIYCLMNADFDHQALEPQTDWADFYAAEFIEHYAPSETPATDKLALYTMAGCPFCTSVNQTIARLGLDIEKRDVRLDRAWREQLIEARGRATVPVLWIRSPDGEVRWMPESMDIIQYLEQMYG